MRTWIRCRVKLIHCGYCSAEIRQGAPMLELTISGTKRARCAACAKRRFGDEPPTEFPEDSLPVPQPSLPMETIRRPDFVTPKVLARSVRYVDAKQRQTGEVE